MGKYKRRKYSNKEKAFEIDVERKGLNYYEQDGKIIVADNLEVMNTPERHFMFKEMLFSFSIEAKAVVKLVFDSPTELMEIGLESGRGISRESLMKYLRRQKNWPFQTIQETFKEIKSGLKELTE